MFNNTEQTDISNTFVPSALQQAIFGWFEHGQGNLIVRARAGTGKTTTILKAIERAPEESILLCAFNKRIQEELADRLDTDRAKAQTLHSVGYRAIREGAPSARLWTKIALPSYAREKWLSDQTTKGMPFGAQRLVAKLVTKARELQPLDATVTSLIQLAADFDLLPSSAENNRLTPTMVATATLRAMELAANEVEPSIGIDYADMIYLPLTHGWLIPEYDLVVVDEAQDMTPAQLMIAKAVCKPGGRIVIVGDDRQAIYGFRGADSQSLDRLKVELRATELPLSRTYRCPKKVVALAQKEVPDYEVDDSAPDGIVDSMNLEALIAAAQPNDFILSRLNAPLAKIAMALLRSKKRAKIQGRDIGAGLLSLVRKLAAGNSVSVVTFLQRLDAWETEQSNRLVAMGREDRVEAIEDQAATLRALSLDAESVEGLIDRIEYLFTDNAEGSVVCSTVHKAKGLEASRVFVLRKTFFMSPRCINCKQPGYKCVCRNYKANPAHVREGANLWYVAVTRSKHHLTMIEEAGR